MPATKVAFTLVGGQKWTGGHSYLLNLFAAIKFASRCTIQPVLFVGDDVDLADLGMYRELLDNNVVLAAAFRQSRRTTRWIRASAFGIEPPTLREFERHAIEAVFENADFYGWRFPLPCVAWIPDFQHRHLPHMFNQRAYWKRELGFRAQIAGGRTIMLSSNDARTDCETFHPSTRGRIVVAKFAVKPPQVQHRIDHNLLEKYRLPVNFIYLPNQFWKHKNHLGVIEALRLLKEANKEVVVAASGNPADPRHPTHYQQLVEIVSRYGLEKNFRLLGLIPFVDVGGLAACCAALINPSLFEGWSTTVEEAKALGTPLLLSDIDVHREQAEVAALYFDPHVPGQIANVLWQAVSTDDPSDRERRRAAAAPEAERRVDEYATQFQHAVEFAIARHRGDRV